MQSDPDAQQSPADWYLIASKGDLVLRLAQDLQIGEDGTGGIVLSPAREDALLRLSTRGSDLTLQALAMDWTFRDADGGTRQHMTFPAGTSVRLNFPTCTLTVTPDFRAGERVRPDHVLELKPISPPTVALARLSEPVTLVDHPAVAWESVPPIGVATTEEVAALLEAALDDQSEQLLEADHDLPDEVPEVPLLEERVIAEAPKPVRAAAPAPDPGIVTPTIHQPRQGTTQHRAASRSDRRRRSRAFSAAAVLAVASLLIPMALLLDRSERPGEGIVRSGHLPPGQLAAPVWPEDPPPAAIRSVPGIEPSVTWADSGVQLATAGDSPAETEARPFEEPLPLADPNPAVTVTPPSATSASGVAARATLSEAEAAQVAVLLAEAQTFFDAGAIVTPLHDNAVERLVRVLTLDPTNEAGLQLMYRSAVRLVEEAEAAHAAGDDYLARNLLEDVLGFHPDFEMARKLQRDWNASGNG